MKRTYQPSKRRRKNKHGFRTRNKTKNGKKVLAKRRAKGRKSVAIKKTGKQSLLKKLKKNSDFLKLKNSGKKVRVSDWLQIQFLETPEEGLEKSLYIGVTTGRKVGSAVVRNKLKRWCREHFKSRKSTYSLVSGSINIVFRPHKKENFYQDLKHEFLDSEIEKSLRFLRKNS